MRNGEFEFEILVEAARGQSQDAAGVFPAGDGLLMVVADGAGGTSGGARAAELVVAASAKVATEAAVHDLTGVLHSINAELRSETTAGETTAVLALVANDRISGASVGDSEAWLLSGTDVSILTERQKRKPLLGARRAMPTPFFGRLTADDVLLLGSDGLFKYVRREQLVESISSPAPNALARVRSLLGAPGSALQDDVAMILCRRLASD